MSTLEHACGLLPWETSEAQGRADAAEVNVRLIQGWACRFQGWALGSKRPTPSPLRGRAIVAVFLLLGLALVPGLAAAQRMLSVGETEDLVRMRHYEGLPEDQAERIGPEGCTRLIELLEDPAEARSHAEILLAIGHCGPDGGLEAIAAWADQPRDGEIDRATFRAWQVLPFALAKLAEHDPRAVARLTARLENEDAPRWTFRHHRGERLTTLRKRAAADGLAETDHAEADAALDRAAARATEPGLREHFERARERRRERRERRGEAGDASRRELGRRGMGR